MVSDQVVVLHVITGLNVGGAERMLQKIVTSNGDQSIHSVVLSLSSGGLIADQLALSGISVTSLKSTSIFDRVILIFRVIRFIKKLEPDMIQTWMYHADIIGGVAAKLCSVPLIVWNIRNGPFRFFEKKNGTPKLLTKFVVILGSWLSWVIPNHIFCCSKITIAHHAKMGFARKKFVYISNGFDLEKFRPVRGAKEALASDLGIGGPCFLVGFVGRIEPQKNFRGMLEVAEYASSKRNDVHFVVVGKDSDSSWVKSEISARNLQGNFHLLGLRSDIPYLMAAFDVLVSTSWTEGFSNVIGEAMASETVCVVTNVGDAIVQVGDHGFVVERGDMKGLALRVLELCEDDVKRARLGKNSRAHIAANFDIERIRDRYFREYRRMIHEASCAE